MYLLPRDDDEDEDDDGDDDDLKDNENCLVTYLA